MPANSDNVEGLALSQEGKPQTHSGTAYNISLTLVNWFMKHDLRMKCMLICCKCPLPGSHLIVPLFQSALSVFSPIRVPSFIFRKSYTSISLVNLCCLASFNQISVFNGKSHCCKRNLHDPRTTFGHRYQRICTHQFSTYYIGKT